MGFWDTFTSIASAIGRGAGSIIESVGNYFGKEKIAGFGKSLKNACSNVRSNVKKVASTENHKKESAVRVERINNVFVEFYEDMSERAEEIEEACIDYSEEYFDNILNVLSKQSDDIKNGLNLDKLKRTRKKIRDAIDGFIQKDISQKVSLDNSKCMKIMQIKDDDERGEAMQVYCENVVERAIEKLDKKVQKILNKQNEEIEEFLLDYEEKRAFSLEKMKEQLLEMENQEKEILEKNQKEVNLKQLRVIMYMDAITDELA